MTFGNDRKLSLSKKKITGTLLLVFEVFEAAIEFSQLTNCLH